MKTIMIFPAGSEIGIEIYNALKYNKELKIVGGTSIADHSSCIYEKLVSLPYIIKCTKEEFVHALNRVIEEEKIDYIYPAHDMAQYLLMTYQQELNASIISSPMETISLCHDKMETYNIFNNEEFIPKIFHSVEQVKGYPVFVKPRIGHSSIGAKIIKNEKELKLELESNNDIVVAEFLPGKEYTIDCFTADDGTLVAVQSRLRERIKAGISVRSTIVNRPTVEVEKIANTINSRIRHIGAWFFQVREDVKGKLKLLEIGPRIAGTMGLSRNRGINYPLLTLYQFMGIKAEIMLNSYNINVDRAFFGRYSIDIDYNTIYLDFDDTLIIDGKINCTLIMFIYQQKNEGKHIVLLSRHRKDIEKSLSEHRIDKKLFDNLIVLDENESKADYIKDKKAIFIDDSFRERLDVHKQTGIFTFDLDMVESLIDWRGIK